MSNEASNSLSVTISAETKCVLISAALGCLGFLNTVLVGVHVAILYFRLSDLNKSFLTNAYVMTGITVGSAFMLIFGSYLIWKGKGQRGGILNLVAGVVTLVLFCYFVWVFPLLRQFEPVGYFLAVPAVTSGLLALFVPKISSNRSRSARAIEDHSLQF